MTSDQINFGMYLTASILSCDNIRLIVRDKYIHGTSIWPGLFFTIWGCWDIWYFSSIKLYWTAAGNVLIAGTWLTWLILVWRFYALRRDRKHHNGS